MACAHKLATLGHEVTVFEARRKPGGLNEFGIAAYKTVDDFAQREVEYILGVGGISVEYGKRLGRQLKLGRLRQQHDAIFLGIGLGAVNDLGIKEDVTGVMNAIDYIAKLRQAPDLAKLPVGRRIVVIGGGMTAIDIASQTKRLGAEEVTIVYRRGPGDMKASSYEQELAQTDGVLIRHWLRPKKLLAANGRLTGVELEYTRVVRGKLEGTGETLRLPCDQLFKAVGQVLVVEDLMAGIGRLALEKGRIRADDEGRTSVAGVWAGGDCVAGGEDLTVAAVEAGKRAALSIDRYLRAGNSSRASQRYAWQHQKRHPGVDTMANLKTVFCGITSPNPFWLASAPPTDKQYNVERAFRAGWGGVVWKTLGEDPPIVNVNGPRYGAIHSSDRKVIGFNNIELITDRPLAVNLREIKEVKRNWPDRALVVSLMVPCEERNWEAILAQVEETDADGVELNFGCPHGMSERGMGSAVGQVPEYVEMVARWCKAHTRMPVIVKLTPNITDVRKPAEAAKRGGADAVSLINTINSIMAVDLDLMAPWPHTDGYATHGGYCGQGGQADRAQHGIGDRPRPGHAQLSDIRHRRHRNLARRGGVHGARGRQCAGMHSRDGVRVQDRRGDDLGPVELDG